MTGFAFDGRDLLQGLAQLKPRTARTVQRRVLTDAAEPMRAQMATDAPRGPTGRLKGETTISNARGQDRQEVAIAIGPSKGAFYGGFQEYGTSRHPAQPFARPAFDTLVQRAVRDISAGIWRELAAKGISRSRVSRGPIAGGAGGGGLL